LDGHGVPLAPALAWHDPRGECEPVRADLGDGAYRRIAGRPLDAVSSLPKLLWLFRHVAGASSAVRFLSVPEWAVHSLGGAPVNELSLVSRTGLFDVPAKAPWDAALSMLGVGRGFLGDIVPAGQPVGLVHEAAPAPLRGAVLTVAGHDHQTAAYALGAAREGTLFDSLGTAEAIVRTVLAPLPVESIDRLARSEVSTGWGVVPDRLCLLAGVPTGISLERLGQLVGAVTPAARTALGRRALAARRSSSSMRITATYHGLTLHDLDDGVEPALAWRAAVEDLTAAADRALAAMTAEVGPHGDVVVAGGWLHNPMVRAAKEAQFGSPRQAVLAEPGAIGAAEMAGVAAGLVAPRWSPPR
ncbi:MAG: FGGY family carbohydrate kinase, partial [Pseudonocardiales bacterium]